MKKYRCKVNGYFDFEQNKVYTEKEIGIFIKNKRDWEIITPLYDYELTFDKSKTFSKGEIFRKNGYLYEII